jgi:hypothetical protein
MARRDGKFEIRCAGYVPRLVHLEYARHSRVATRGSGCYSESTECGVFRHARSGETIELATDVMPSRIYVTPVQAERIGLRKRS